MNEKQKEDVFYHRILELCVEHGKAYGIDCPICGNYAIGMVSESGKTVMGSCATCQIAGRKSIAE